MPSRMVHSSQVDAHPRLADVVRRHLVTPWRRPIPEHTAQVFERIPRPTDKSPWILDGGCGTGDSTFALSRRHPDHRVIGIDQSSHRLQKWSDGGLLAGENVTLCRAEFAAWVQLMAAAGIQSRKTYLLYPNPWPKPAHLQRRWHAHPAFPQILEVSESIEMRTNWRVYALEFHHALRIAGWIPTLSELLPEKPLSPFESKYHHSGHDLYQLVAQRP